MTAEAAIAARRPPLRPRDIVVYGVLTLAAVPFVFPVVWMISASLKLMSARPPRLDPERRAGHMRSHDFSSVFFS